MVQLPGQLVLVHDDSKAQPEYPGLRYFTRPADLAALAPVEQDTLGAAAFRGDPYQGIVCEVEEVAAYSMWLARRFAPVRLVVDETDRAMSDGGKSLLAPSLREAFAVGRNMGLSVLWATQFPQRAPDCALALSSSLGIMQLEPGPLNYLDRTLCFDREMLDTVAVLKVGEFVLRLPGRPWDRTIYVPDAAPM